MTRKMDFVSHQRESASFSRGNNPSGKYTWTDVCQAEGKHVGTLQWLRRDPVQSQFDDQQAGRRL